MGSPSQCAVAFLLVLAFGCGPSPAGEVTPAPVTQAPVPAATAQDSTVSATMLRVLAETADEFRTGSPIFLVAAYRFPHRVLGGFAARSAADSARAAAGSGYGVFGPYLTPADPIADSAARVVGVQLEIETPSGRKTVRVSPDTVDAIFFSESAFDKFAVPYYSNVYGPEFAAELKATSPLQRPKGHCFSRMCLILHEGGTVEMKPFEGPMVR